MFKQSVYKKDTKDKIRVTTIIAEGNLVTQLSGLVDGKMTEHVSKSKPKNVGKTNSTTAEEQAVLEAQAKITKKLKEGYFLTEKEAKESKVILPMLAKSYENEQHKIDWTNAYVQPKLDGMRCLKDSDKMISRKNTPIDTLPHINKDITHIADYLDGELYAHGLSFQENMKLIKKNRPESIDVKYHIYDIVLPNLPFSDRYIILEKMFRAGNFQHCEIVPTYKVRNMKDVQNFHKQFLQEGYEGTMIRWGDEGYKINGRSSNLLKYKDFKDITATIVDVLPSDKNPLQGVVHCKIDNGETFGCGMKFSHKEREEFLTNKDTYIGKTAEIRFFEYTDDGLPRFPIFVGFRLDK